MSVNNSDIVNKYSRPLPCRTCKHALDPIGEFRRDESVICKKYDSIENRKPYGVLFCNQKCELYEKAQ